MPSNAARRDQGDLHHGQWPNGGPSVQKVRAPKPVTPSRTQPATWAVEASTPDLWQAFLYGVEDRRCAALNELVEREDSAVVPVVITRLGRTYLEHTDSERHALLRATPRIQVTDESLRAALAENLWDIADKLQQPRNEEEEALLWTAIRRYATLRPEADIGKLVAFLGEPDEPLPRRHVVLLAIQNAFYAQAPTDQESAKLEPLRQRVSELARRYLDTKWPEGDDENAVTLSAYCAALVLGCADIDALTNLVISRNERYLLKLTLQDSLPMVQRWRIRKDGSGTGRVPDAVEFALAKLTHRLEEQGVRVAGGSHAHS